MRRRMLGGEREGPICGCLWERETEVQGGGRICSRAMCGAAAWPRWVQNPSLLTSAQILLLRLPWGSDPAPSVAGAHIPYTS